MPKSEVRDSMSTSIGPDRHLLSQDDYQSQLQKKKIYKNLVVVSIAFLFLFTAFQALSNLQSSINIEQGLGTVGLSVIYGVLVISCMFVPAPAIDFLGYKQCIAVSMVCYIIYIAANFYATWVTLIPGSVVVGLGAAPLWSAKCAYLTASGKKYAQLSGETAEAVVSRFFGTFFMIFQSSQIWGNIVASTILQVRNENNSYVTPTADDVMEKCGACYCNDVINNTNLDRPSDLKIYTLMGVYLGCSCVALFIVMCFLNNIDHREYSEDGTQDSAKSYCSGSLIVETYRHLRHTNQLLLIPLTLLTGMEQGFVGSDFTKSYISCSFGIWMVGYIMICYGITDVFFCMLFGKVVKYIGRIPVFTFGAVVHIAILVTLLIWRTRPDQLVVLFVLAAIWGMCDAVWQTQVNALYGCLFYERVGAFSNHRMWQSIGFIVAFAYSSFICTDIKIYVLIGVLLVGMIGYYIVEWREYKQEDIKVPGIDFT